MHISGTTPLTRPATADELRQRNAELDARITKLEACIREMQQAVPGGSIVDPQVVADAMRAIADAHGVQVAD